MKYKLVPVEPTAEMRDALFFSTLSANLLWTGVLAAAPPLSDEEVERVAMLMAEAEGFVWSQMFDQYSVKWDHNAVKETWRNRASAVIAALEG